MCFISFCDSCVLNVANDDESVATASRVSIQIGCVRVHLETYECVGVDILTGLCKLFALIDVPVAPSA